jgi:hypothetical protein
MSAVGRPWVADEGSGRASKSVMEVPSPGRLTVGGLISGTLSSVWAVRTVKAEDRKDRR